MEENVYKMINIELMKKGYSQCNNLEKVLLVQDELRNYLIQKIIKNNCIKMEDYESLDISTIFMIISYSLDKEQLNNVIFFMLNVIGSNQGYESIWAIDDSKVDSELVYTEDGKLDKLVTNKNYNVYQTLCLVYNKLDEIKDEKKLALAC